MKITANLIPKNETDLKTKEILASNLFNNIIVLETNTRELDRCPIYD